MKTDIVCIGKGLPPKAGYRMWGYLLYVCTTKGTSITIVKVQVTHMNTIEGVRGKSAPMALIFLTQLL